MPKIKIPIKLKDRERYIFFKVISENEEKVTKRELAREIWKTGLSLFGELGLKDVGIKIINFNKAGKNGIIRCSHKEMDKAKTILSFITSIGGEKASIITLTTSGTLKALKRKVKKKDTVKDNTQSH